MNNRALSELLHEAAAPIWADCLSHPFVVGLGDGTLDVEKFRYFLLQDYLYLLDYARVFALGVVKTRDPELMRVFASNANAILDGEMNLHRAYMKRLGVTEEQALSVRPALDSLSYTSYMLSVAHVGTPVEIVASILACSWSYAEIGRTLARIPGALEHPFYGEWIRSYSSAEYTSSNDALIKLIDQLATPLPDEQLDHLVDIFVHCSRYELNFWDMAWEMRV